MKDRIKEQENKICEKLKLQVTTNAAILICLAIIALVAGLALAFLK